MKKLLLLPCFIFILGMGGSGQHRYIAPAAGCTPPTMTYRWAASSLTGTNNCGSSGTSACTNGSTIYTWPESVSSNNAVQTGSSFQPTFNTSQINGLPAVLWNGSFFLAMNTPIPTSVTTYTFYAVVKPVSFSITGPMVGSANGVSGGLAWSLRTTAVQYLASSSIGVIAANTTTLSAGTWYTLAVTYNSSTQAYTFYGCSAGSCTAQGSGTGASYAITNPTAYIGNTGSGLFTPDYYMAEIGFLNGSSVSGVAAWSYCEYGI